MSQNKMSRCAFSLSLAFTLLLSSGVAQAASKNDSVKVVRTFNLGRLAKYLSVWSDLAELVGQLHNEDRPARVQFSKEPKLEQVLLVARFKIPEVSATKSAIGLADVIGIFQVVKDSRRIEATLLVDVVVEVSMDLAKVQVTKDRDFPDTIVITLPEFIVREPEIPEDGVHFKTASYGLLRAEWKDGGTAAELMSKALEEAKQEAKAHFKDSLSSYQDDVVKDLQQLLRKQLPKARIYVKR